jgi:uncharacterized protein
LPAKLCENGRELAPAAGQLSSRPLGCRVCFRYCHCIIKVMEDRDATESILSLLRAIKPELEAQFAVDTVALFGSYARGGQRYDSDIDILVSFKQPPSLLGFIELENALSESLGAKVDLVMEEALKPRIGQRIREEMLSV